jgi:hypothetical protein
MERYKSILSVFFSGDTCGELKFFTYCGMSCNLVAKDINVGFVPEGAFPTVRASLAGEGSFVHVAWVLKKRY